MQPDYPIASPRFTGTRRADIEADRTATRHPCFGLTQTCISAFEQVAAGFRPRVSGRIISRLIEEGLIKSEGRMKVRLGMFESTVPRYGVPERVMAQYRQWAAEQPHSKCERKYD